MRNFTFVCLFIGTSLFSFSASSAGDGTLPPVFHYYPDCEYPVIDEISVKRKLLIKNKELDKQNEASVITESISKIRRIAADRGASGVILTRRLIHSPEKKLGSKLDREKPTMESFAELVGECEGEMVFSPRLTPLDNEGKKQIVLGKIDGWKKQIVFNLNDKYQKLEPELTSSRVDLDSVYGLKLGTSVEQTTTLFGTPSMRISLDVNTQLLSYGRNHWLLFKNQQLVSITTKNQWLSSEVVNHIRFDDRFDSLDWQVLGKVVAGQELSVAVPSVGAKKKAGNQYATVTGKDSNLRIWFEGEVDGNESIVQKVTAFTLHKNTVNYSAKISDNHQVYQQIADYIQQNEHQGMEKSALQPFSTGEIWLDKTSKMLMFNGHLLALVKGESVSKLFYLEQVFTDKYQPQDSNWWFERVTQGQTMGQIMEKLGDEAFGFDDTLEVTAEPYTKELYFYEDKLISAEISVF